MLPTCKTLHDLSTRLHDIEEEVKNSKLKDAIELALANSKLKLDIPFENLD